METPCIPFRGHINQKGYGVDRLNGRVITAHRAAYIRKNGEIDRALQVDHLCHCRSCVNHEHLEAVTARENVLRSTGVSAINANKTHCHRGHPFSGPNLRIVKGHERSCRVCENMLQRARRALEKVLLARGVIEMARCPCATVTDSAL